MDYKEAGVDIQAGDELVDWLKKTQPSQQPHQDRLVSGGFASLFRIGFPEMSDPCLVTSTDGVGTKLKIAIETQNFSTIGQDLVAMCVNDLVCCGAKPLLFLDYYATGKLRLEEAKSFLNGVRQACIDSDCLLAGGETAEMPGMYQGGDFDCAGFSVGVVDREKSIGSHRVEPGQKLIALKSSGFHSNGYSLVRKLFAEDLNEWVETLLKPTRLYPKVMNALLQKNLIQAAAHITGGGLDNLLRVLPDQIIANIDRWSWDKEFVEAQKRSALSETEMLKTFNCGVGMILVVQPDQVSSVHQICKEMNFESFDLGDLSKGDESQKEYRLRG